MINLNMCLHITTRTVVIAIAPTMEIHTKGIIIIIRATVITNINIINNGIITAHTIRTMIIMHITNTITHIINIRKEAEAERTALIEVTKGVIQINIATTGIITIITTITSTKSITTILTININNI